MKCLHSISLCTHNSCCFFYFRSLINSLAAFHSIETQLHERNVRRGVIHPPPKNLIVLSFFFLLNVSKLYISLSSKVGPLRWISKARLKYGSMERSEKRNIEVHTHFRVGNEKKFLFLSEPTTQFFFPFRFVLFASNHRKKKLIKQARFSLHQSHSLTLNSRRFCFL